MAQERELLERYLDSFERLLDYVVIERPSFLYRDLMQPTLNAWKELKEQNITRKAKLIFQEMEADHELESKLRDIGLFGYQLEWKISSYFFFYNRFFVTTPLSRRLLKQVLKWADVILGSLATVLPILEPIKEYKEGIEATLIEDPSTSY